MTLSRPCRRPARERGMTLIEIMVVIVIVAVIVSMAVISLGDNNARQLDEEQRRVKALLQMAADDAVLSGREIGFSVDDDTYRFLVFDDELQGWQSLEQESAFRPRKLPSGVRMELYLDDQQIVLPSDLEDEDEDDKSDSLPPPQVLLLSSGEMTPFAIRLEHENTDLVLILRGYPNGFLEEDVERL